MPRWNRVPTALTVQTLLDQANVLSANFAAVLSALCPSQPGRASLPFCLPRLESRAPQIHARGLELIEDLPCLLVSDAARHEPCHDLHQSALHGRYILQRRGFKPSLTRTLCVFLRAPGLLALVSAAIPPASHRGASAAGGVVHPVLA